MNVLSGKEPRGVPFVPFQIAACQKAACTVQNEIFPKRQFELLNGKPDIGAAESGEILAGEILETARRQVPNVCGIGIRVMGTEMRRDDKHLGAIARDAVNLSHGPRQIADMLDDVGHMDAVERIAVHGPRKLVQIPNDVGSGSRMNVDANGLGFHLTGTAADIQNRQRI